MAAPLIITGMHRSGTSLVASLVRAGGVHMGDELIEANSANPRGYFEDVDFYEFHEQILHDRGQTYLYVNPDFTFEPTEAELVRARGLIDARLEHPIWGWKDPRTSLFLDFWREQLPDARFLFVYRHPLHVLLSLMRRGEFDSYPVLSAGLEAWQIYNSRIYSFCSRWPEGRVLASVEGIVDGRNDFVGLMSNNLGVELRLSNDALEQLICPDELNRTRPTRQAAAVFAKICPTAIDLHDELNAQADLPEPTQILSESPGPLAGLEVFSKGLSSPIMPAVRQGILQVLLALMDPCASDDRMGRIRNTAQDQQSKLDQIWQYAQQLQRVNAELRTSLDKRDDRVAALAAQSHRQQHLIHQQQREIDAQAREIQNLWPERVRAVAIRAWQYLRGA